MPNRIPLTCDFFTDKIPPFLTAEFLLFLFLILLLFFRLFIFKLIAESAQSHYAISVRAEIATQHLDMGIDGAVVAVEIKTPYLDLNDTK